MPEHQERSILIFINSFLRKATISFAEGWGITYLNEILTSRIGAILGSKISYASWLNIFSLYMSFEDSDWHCNLYVTKTIPLHWIVVADWWEMEPDGVTFIMKLNLHRVHAELLLIWFHYYFITCFLISVTCHFLATGLGEWVCESLWFNHVTFSKMEMWFLFSHQYHVRKQGPLFISKQL